MHLDDATRVFGLSASEGQYYFSDSDLNQIRRVPPAFVVAETRGSGPLVVDDKGVYFYETEAPFVEHSGAIRLVPRDGGALITTADRISVALDLAEDATDLVFPMGDPNGYRISQVSRFGGEVRTLACGSAARLGMRIAIADLFVYWTDERGLYRTPKFGIGAR
jgi:hypothetical protein